MLYVLRYVPRPGGDPLRVNRPRVVAGEEPDGYQYHDALVMVVVVDAVGKD